MAERITESNGEMIESKETTSGGEILKYALVSQCFSTSYVYKDINSIISIGNLWEVDQIFQSHVSYSAVREIPRLSVTSLYIPLFVHAFDHT